MDHFSRETALAIFRHHLKIGCSENVEVRVQQLEGHYGVPLALLGTMPGGREEEKAGTPDDEPDHDPSVMDTLTAGSSLTIYRMGYDRGSSSGH